MKYRKHIFICVNERKDGKKSCGEAHGMKLVQAFKDLIFQHGIRMEVRAQRAGCLDVCAFGPAMVVYPEGVFYGNVQEADVEEIFNRHILMDEPVERLRLGF